MLSACGSVPPPPLNGAGSPWLAYFGTPPSPSDPMLLPLLLPLPLLLRIM
jgi:hypothetical protein